MLIGVINRKRDLMSARHDGWYRIPQERMPYGLDGKKYIGFFLSGKVFKELSGSVAYYATLDGVELAYRRDLLPKEPNHKNADKVYYRLALRDFSVKAPPVRNESKRSIAFIHTTWDRFINARTIADLYTKDDRLVDRIYHALRTTRTGITRYWDAQRRETGYGAGIRVLCQEGAFIASAEARPGTFFLDWSLGEDELLKQIKMELAKLDGPAMGSLGVDGY